MGHSKQFNGRFPSALRMHRLLLVGRENGKNTLLTTLIFYSANHFQRSCGCLVWEGYQFTALTSWSLYFIHPLWSFMYTIHCERSTLSHFLRRNSCHRLSHTEWWCMMYCPTCNVNRALPQSWGGACSRPTRHTALWLSQVLLSCSQHLPDWILASKDTFCT